VFYFYSPEGTTCLATNVVSAENRKFFPAPPHSAPSFGVTPFEFFTVPETRVFQATDGEDLAILACTIFD